MRNLRFRIVPAAIGLGLIPALASFGEAAPQAVPVVLNSAGEKLVTGFEAELAAVRTELANAIPAIGRPQKAALDQAGEAVRKAGAELKSAQQNLGKLDTAKALVAHAKGKWLGGAAKGIAQAEEALNNAQTDSGRDWQQCIGWRGSCDGYRRRVSLLPK